MVTKGQNHYGMTDEKQLQLLAIGRDVELTKKAHFAAFYDSTVRAAVHAMDLAKAGEKDAARNWHRYFTQAGILTLLTESDSISHSKLVDLKLVLIQLRDACHPDERISLETDIQHIRQMLEMLVEHAESNKSPFLPFLRSRSENQLSTAN